MKRTFLILKNDRIKFLIFGLVLVISGIIKLTFMPAEISADVYKGIFFFNQWFRLNQSNNDIIMIITFIAPYFLLYILFGNKLQEEIRDYGLSLITRYKSRQNYIAFFLAAIVLNSIILAIITIIVQSVILYCHNSMNGLVSIIDVKEILKYIWILINNYLLNILMINFLTFMLNDLLKAVIIFLSFAMLLLVFDNVLTFPAFFGLIPMLTMLKCGNLIWVICFLESLAIIIGIYKLLIHNDIY